MDLKLGEIAENMAHCVPSVGSAVEAGIDTCSTT